MPSTFLRALPALLLLSLGQAQDGTPDGGKSTTPKPIGPADVVPTERPTGVGPGIPVPLPPETATPTGPRLPEGELPLLVWRDDPTAWQHGWWLDRGELLDPPGGLAMGPRTGAGSEDDAVAVAAAHARLRDEAVGGLLAVLEQERDLRVRRETLLALGRLGGGHAAVQRALVDALRENPRELSEAALLALGLSGSLEGAIELAAVLRDDAHGRELLDTNRVDARRRSTAAYALALAANRTTRPELVRFAAHHLDRMLRDPERSDDLEAAVVLSLGALPAASPALAAGDLVDALLERLEDRRASDATRAHAPTALARLAAPHAELRERVARDLIARIAPRAREEDAVRESAVLALGLLGDADGEDLDREIRSALAVALRKGEGLERRYAAVSLGRVGARAGDASFGAPRAAQREVEALLVDHARRARSRERVWGGLALGRMGASLRAQGALLDAASADALLDGLSSSKSAENSVGFSIACGLIGDPRARDGIVDRISALGEREARGQLGVALGILGAPDTLSLLRQEFSDSKSDPDWHGWAALAVAAGGDRAVADALAVRLLDLDSSTEVEAIANALRWLGGAAALEVVLQRLGDERLSSAARSSLARAAGWIGDERGKPWRNPLTVGLNPRLAPASLIGRAEPGALDRLLP